MKSYFFKFFMLASILIFSGCSVDGTVKDENGAFISGANVVAVYDGGTQSTTTDNEGHYSIDNLENVDTVSVSVSKDMYLTQTQSTTLNSRGATLDFTLLSDEVDAEYGNITGSVFDTAGKPLSGVKVYTSSSETMTDANGTYSLHVKSSEAVSVTAMLEDYATNSRNIMVNTDETSTLDLTLATVDKIVTFDVNDGATISTKGASVELPASSIVNEDGSSFNGNVIAKVTFNQVSSFAGRNAFPGDYLGLNKDGSKSVLQSYGFIDVTLEDENGAKLRLADGSTATLSYPMDTSIDTTPDSIPLWYYDIKKGIWVEDGVATYDAATHTYVGEVSHFTTWNLDAKFDGAEFNGCITDSNGVPVTDATLVVTAQGLNKSKHNLDTDGKFKFINAPSNLEITLKAIVNGVLSDEKVFTLQAGEVKTFSECLGFDATQLENPDAVEKYSKVKGKVLYSDGSAVSNQYITIETSNGSFSSSTDENGSFTTNAFLRPNDKDFTLDFSTYIENNDVHVVRNYTLDSQNVITNIGIIEVKISHVKGCVIKADGNTTFDNYSYINIDNPYSENHYNIDQNGNFSFILDQNSQNRTAYAFTNNAKLTAPFTFKANHNIIDLTSNCIVLEDAIDLNKTVHTQVTSSNSDIYVKVIYDTYANYDYPSLYGDKTLLGGSYWEYDDNTSNWTEITTPKELSGDFNLTTNGVYFIHQAKDNWEYENFDGSIIFTLDNNTTSLTIEDNATANEAWAGFAIEVYQGDYKIIELNKAADSNVCRTACSKERIIKSF